MHDLGMIPSTSTRIYTPPQRFWCEARVITCTVPAHKDNDVCATRRCGVVRGRKGTRATHQCDACGMRTCPVHAGQAAHACIMRRAGV